MIHDLHIYLMALLLWSEKKEDREEKEKKRPYKGVNFTGIELHSLSLITLLYFLIKKNSSYFNPHWVKNQMKFYFYTCITKSYYPSKVQQ